MMATTESTRASEGQSGELLPDVNAALSDGAQSGQDAVPAKKRTVKKAAPAAEGEAEATAPPKSRTKTRPAEESEQDAAAPEAAASEAPKKRTRKVADAEPVAVEGSSGGQEPEELEPRLDFSDEDAALAAEAPEFDLGEENEHDFEGTGSTQTEHSLAGKSKEELVGMLAMLLESKPVQTLRRDVEAIKMAFYKLHRVDVDQARNAFVEAGGLPEDFVGPLDATEQRFKDLFKEYRRHRDEFLSTLEHAKEDNLKVKLHIIDELKELIDSGETINHTFNLFRELQQRWRDTGPVPQTANKDLWDTYNHHVENFYNYIKINKELRDLDLKRNYEAKLTLCEEAEALILEPSIVSAFHRLQKLHEQWRETGPVANEYKETLWERFREASGRINKQHQEHFEGLKDEQKRNLDLKVELCVKVDELCEQPFTARKEWNRASDRLIEIQKVWKTIGFAPKKDNTKIYDRFRKACDRFFELKRKYYLQMKSEMEMNLQLKEELCAQAEATKDTEEWKKGTDELIALQKRWREIGPVPRRYSDSVWKRFRAACDAFFSRKSGHFSSVDTEHDENLRLKNALLDEIEAAGSEKMSFDDIKIYQRRWSEIGFVPIRQKDAIQARYKKLMDSLFSSLRGAEGARRMDRFRDHVSSLRTGGEKRLRTERDRLYVKVKQLEQDIALLENNIGFFSKSKNAEAMIRDVRDKIERARAEMSAAIEKVNMIDKDETGN